MEPMPVTGNPKIDHWLAVLGLVMSVSSTAASLLNARIRSALDMGEQVPALFVWLGLVVNYLAMNIDKAAQLHRLLKGGEVVVTRVGTIAKGGES
jgi:hypothetical protein